jgi:hypothetical protein
MGGPRQVEPSRLQRADASFELAPNTAIVITGMDRAILDNIVRLVQFSSLLERVLGKKVSWSRADPAVAGLARM